MNKYVLRNIPLEQKFLVVRDGQTFRAKRESEDNIFVFAPRRSRYGYRMMEDTFCSWYELAPKQKSPAEKWQADVKKVIKKLEKSGLWPEILEQFKVLQKVSYEDRQAISALYRSLSYKSDRTEEELREYYGEYWDKYPFMFSAKDHSGLDYFYLTGGMSDAKTKSIYFGFCNKQAKERIKAAMAEGRKCSEYGRTSYDVTFSYEPASDNPEKCSFARAWYSEEYKNCGNGHYYLALDENCALFCEDD